ncbi:hypothetical protein N658DRAFT_459610 [Parathielavia hyrcaniae]|uniref:C2H2-type domain-containing protein n=1 Tax=Parathielavia hyrcaniae TaxID=113614 RepID=A0AAN6SWS4_9PEZI|nr:hypothetical protein N658DRAFT_459610 [Parathielavia hyrcaniae]
MGLVTLLRGFKVPIAVLDRFLAAHDVQETEHIPPYLFPPHLFRGRDGTSASTPQLDPQSAFFRARLAASNPDPASLEAVRLFIPHRRGQDRSAYGYVAYAFVMVFGQRYVDLAIELPEQAPPGFAALRREVLGAGLASGCWYTRPGGRERVFCSTHRATRSDLRCEQCAAEFETWSALHVHRSELHGVDIMSNPLPDDL